MSEILQTEESVKLYEYSYIKPDLDDCLEHHGILGMHWGRKNGPPYPLDSKVSTGKRLKPTSGRIRRKRKRALKKARKVRAENAKRRIEEQKSKEEIMKTKDIKAMAKNLDKFSNQEINDMLNRLDTERRLKEKVLQIERVNTPKSKKMSSFVKENVKAGLTSGASSILKTVSKNAVKIGSKKLVKELVGEENKDLQDFIDKLFKEEKK